MLRVSDHYDDSERTGKQIEREPGLQPENWRAPTRELEGANPRTGGNEVAGSEWERTNR